MRLSLRPMHAVRGSRQGVMRKAAGQRFTFTPTRYTATRMMKPTPQTAQRMALRAEVCYSSSASMRCSMLAECEVDAMVAALPVLASGADSATARGLAPRLGVPQAGHLSRLPALYSRPQEHLTIR